MSFDIQSIKRKMLVKYPFFGSVVANVEYKQNTGIETSETDSKVVYYNPKFLDTLRVDEQIFIFAHEICHIAFNHILRSEGKNPFIWNIATDAVINAFLKRDGLKMVAGGVDIADAINYDAEQLYEKLFQERKQQKHSRETSKKEVFGHHTHSMWKDAIKKHKKTQEKSSQQSVFEQLGEKESFKKNLAEKKKALKELKKSLSQQALGLDFSTNEDIRNITDIGRAKPLIDWRYVLREAIKCDVDWSYKNATIEDGVISAILEEQPMPEVEIVLDTSGSIDETLFKNFLRECMNILQHSRVKVGCFDTKFYGFHEIRTEEDIENMKFEGKGGTDFNVAVNAFSRRVENKIIFTDGAAEMPDMPLDAIWIVFDGAQINPKGGKVIQIDDEQLEQLNFCQQDNLYKGRSR